MPKENNDTWTNQESSWFDDFFKDTPDNTPAVDDYEPSSVLRRQVLNLLFMIDVSGSMRGTRIAQVNYALENIFKELRNRDDMYAEIKVGMMEFSDNAKWITSRPIPLDDYVFTQIQAQPWYTCYGKAFIELEKVLHRALFMNPSLGEYFAPLILFITDGEPVDVDEYPAALAKLKNNKWFAKSAKYAIAVGEEAKNAEIGKLLSQFTGVRENVRYADEGKALCDLIEFIAVRASEVQTSMVSSGGSTGNPNEGSSGFGMGNNPQGGNSIFSDVDESLFSSMFSDEK